MTRPRRGNARCRALVQYRADRFATDAGTVSAWIKVQVSELAHGLAEIAPGHPRSLACRWGRLWVSFRKLGEPGHDESRPGRPPVTKGMRMYTDETHRPNGNAAGGDDLALNRTPDDPNVGWHKSDSRPANGPRAPAASRPILGNSPVIQALWASTLVFNQTRTQLAAGTRQSRFKASAVAKTGKLNGLPSQVNLPCVSDWETETGFAAPAPRWPATLERVRIGVKELEPT